MYLDQIEKISWKQECDMSVPFHAMTVQIGFSHDENDNDETEFCINAWDKEELAELFEDFCESESIINATINSISIMRVASSVEELAEIELEYEA